MPVAIGIRTASASPWDGAIIDLAAVSVSPEGEILGEFHEYVKADGFRAYKPAALAAANATWEFLNANGGDESAVVLEWVAWLDKFVTISSPWIASSEGFPASEQLVFIGKRLSYIDRHVGLPRILEVETTTAALVSLGLAPKEVRANAISVNQWLGYTEPTASDDAMERAMRTAKAATILNERLSHIHKAVAAYSGTDASKLLERLQA